MVDWNDIKKAFEKDNKTAEQINMENEQKLLTSIAECVCTLKGVTALQGYQPEEISVFLEKPASEIKQLLGGEWLNMDDGKLELLIYSLSKKVKKSESLLEW